MKVSPVGNFKANLTSMKKSNARPELIAILLTLLLVLTPAIGQQRTAPVPSKSPAQQREAGAPARVADALETDVSFDTLVAAESYAVYLEVRRIGQLAGSREFNELLETFTALAAPPKELADTIEFFKTHAEALENAQMLVASMPTQPGLPQAIGAIQLSSVEEAKSVEPALRGLINKYEIASQATGADESRKTPAAGRKQEARRTRRTKVAGKTRREKEPAPPSFYFKRVGRLLLTSDAPVNAKGFRKTGQLPLTSNARLQAARSRLASEQIFVYFDVRLIEKSTRVQREAYMERAKKEEETRAANPPPDAAGASKEVDPGNPTLSSEINSEVSATVGVIPPDELPPPPAPIMAAEAETGDMRPQGSASTEVRAPGEEEIAVGRADYFLSGLFGMAMGGLPIWPEAVALGASLGGDTVVIRALLVNRDAGEFRIVPFLPMLVSGPEIVPGAASVVPADTEAFVTLSLDWQNIYAYMLGGFNRQQTEMEMADRANGEEVRAETQPAEKSIEAMEKLFGFKIKEDLLPALGNEVAVSAPLDWFDAPGFSRGRRAAKAPDAAEPGFVVFISLNNADTVRKILPRVLEAFGMKTLGAAGQTERRAGLEINNYGGVSTAFINNYLALATQPHPLRHIADSLSGQGTLASDEGYRSTLEWQPRQSLAQAYVSRSLIEGRQKEMRMWMDPNDRELQDLLTRFDVRPSPAAYAITKEGGGDVFHEIHFPVGIIKLLGASDTVSKARATPARQNETSAIRALYAIADAQEAFKAAEGKGSYASYEELFAGTDEEKQKRRNSSGMYTGEGLEKLEYRVTISATGDRFTVHATPKEYGKSGRRSFYLDETGVVRGADHAGQPANAGDPPVD